MPPFCPEKEGGRKGQVLTYLGRISLSVGWDYYVFSGLHCTDGSANRLRVLNYHVIVSFRLNGQ